MLSRLRAPFSALLLFCAWATSASPLPQTQASAAQLQGLPPAPARRSRATRGNRRFPGALGCRLPEGALIASWGPRSPPPSSWQPVLASSHASSSALEPPSLSTSAHSRRALRPRARTWTHLPSPPPLTLSCPRRVGLFSGPGQGRAEPADPPG